MTLAHAIKMGGDPEAYGSDVCPGSVPGLQVQQDVPTQDELAEWEMNGCVMCGEPGTSLVATHTIVGTVISGIAYDGSFKTHDTSEVARVLDNISCGMCGEVLWSK